MIFIKVITARYSDEAIINLNKIKMIYIGGCQLHFEDGERLHIKQESMNELVKFIERGEY